MEYAQLIYEAVRYFKLFTTDLNQKSKESFIQKDINVRRSSKYNFNWVTGGLLGYVEAVVDGKMVNVVYGKGELVKFTNKLVLVDTVTTNQLNQFAFGDYLTDMFILSKKLYAAVQILQTAGVLITVEELRNQGVMNLIHILESIQKHAFAMKLCKLFDLSREDIVIDYILQLIVRNP